MQSREKRHGAVLVPEKTEELLNRRQYFAYKDHRRDLVNWLWTRGKHPERGEGYAKATIRIRAARLDQFYRFVWDREGCYTEDITPAHA